MRGLTMRLMKGCAAGAVIGLAAGGLVAGGAVAGEMQVSGTAAYAVTPVSQYGLPGGGSVAVNALKTVLMGSDTGNPFHGNLQDCIGSSLNDAAGNEIEGNGTCVASRGADVWWLTYRNTPAARTWTVIGGTGRFTGMTGSGTTTPVGGGDGRFAISWTGTVKLAD